MRVLITAKRLLTLLVSEAGAICVAGVVGDHGVLWRLQVSTPAGGAVGHGENVLSLLQTDQLAIAGALVLVGAMAFEWSACRKAANGHGRTRFDDGRGRGDGLPHHGGGRCGSAVVLCGGGEQHRRRGEDGHESDEDHGCDCGCGGGAGIGRRGW